MIWINLLYHIFITYIIGYSVFNILNIKRYDQIINLIHIFLLGLGVSSICFWSFLFVCNGELRFFIYFEHFYCIILFLIAYKKLNKEGKIHKNGSDLIKNIETGRYLNKKVCLEVDKEDSICFFNNLKINFKWRIYIFLQIILIACICLNCSFGGWDAQSMWNLKAKFIAFGNDKWINIFNKDLNIHSDYPLFLPIVVGRGWLYIGIPLQIIPVLYAFIFTVSCLVLLYKYLEIKFNPYIGIIGVILLSSDFIFYKYCSWQYADIALALYTFISFFFLKEYCYKRQLTYLISCIVFAMFTPWIKNEGKVFWLICFISIVAFILLQKTISLKKIGKYFSLFVPIFVALVQLSSMAKCENDLFIDIYKRIFFIPYLERSKFIFNYIINSFPIYYLLIILFFVIYSVHLLIIHKKVFIVYNIVLVNLFVYFLIYLITPHDLLWQLETSCLRIFIHFFPSLIYLLICVIYNKYSKCNEEHNLIFI